MKECFKCKEVKALTEFYKHKQMADGHLNKCKDCTKTDVHKHRAENIEKVRAYDRDRPNKKERQEKQIVYHRHGKGKEVKAVCDRNYRERYPMRYKANSAVYFAIKTGKLTRPSFCEKCGVACKPQGHHDDYSAPLAVRWLCVQCHNTFHNFVREIFRNLYHTGLNYPFEGE